MRSLILWSFVTKIQSERLRCEDQRLHMIVIIVIVKVINLPKRLSSEMIRSILIRLIPERLPRGEYVTRLSKTVVDQLDRLWLKGNILEMRNRIGLLRRTGWLVESSFIKGRSIERQSWMV